MKMQYGCRCIICSGRETFDYQKGMSCEKIIDSLRAKGLFIKGYFICNNCHDQLNYLSPGDKDYQLSLEKIKRIWL